MRLARLGVAGSALYLLFSSIFAQVSRTEVRLPGGPRRPEVVDVRQPRSSTANDEQKTDPALFGSIETVSSGNPALFQQVFGHREDVFLAGGPVSTPCQFPDYLPDGNYYFQVTDPSGLTLLSTDVVSERSVTVKSGVISAYNGKTHATDGKTACGSLAVNLMPYSDAGSRKAAYLVWLTPAASFDGNTSAVDNVCGAGCFHGFHADLSLTFPFRVEDKLSCEPTFCVSGVKFEDKNGNGVRDSGEAGIAGVRVRVTNENGVVLLSGLTGADGSYRICGLTDGGAFKVSESAPFGFKQTGPLDADVSRHVFARAGGYIIELCQEDISGLDFGNQLIPNAIGGLKFEDLNANGARDPGEPGLAGVTIVLTPTGAGNPRTAVTDANGNFLFTDVAPGSYVLTEVVPTGFTQTLPASDGIPVTLVSGGSSINNLFGNFRGILTGTISGAKFQDINGNGVRDAGEPGLAGVTITLSSATQPSRTTVTGSDGSFSFTGVPFGTYTLTETVPAGFAQTAPPSPGTLTATLDFGHQAVSGLLFGNRAVPATISGTKFNDVNGNGVRDSGEGGLAGVTITLRSSTGPVLTTTTDSSGSFSFLGLTPGTFTLSETVPAGFTQTAPPSPGTFTITVAPGQNATGFLFGNRSTAGPQPASISGVKFEDKNGNGVQDSGELGLAGVTIQALTPIGNTLTTTTAATTGAFTFTGLAAGTYVLSELVPTGYKQTTPATVSVTVAAGQNATGVVFGNQLITGATGSISGKKYLDLNVNGVLDAIDLPLQGITIVLTDSLGATRQTVSAADGSFSFTNLPPGTYVLSEILPSNFFQTFPGTPTKPGTYTITLTAGQNATGFLFLNKC